MQLSDLIFSDIYVGQSASWLAGVPNEGDPVPAPEEVSDELIELREQCSDFATKSSKMEFAIRHAGIAYRVSLLKSLSETVYVLRRFPTQVPDLGALNLHKGYVAKLLEPRLSGLIVVAGAFGQGKTTTASALIRARLEKFGGVAVTIEDPPEMPLEGRHGLGVCFQTWVDQGGFGHACRQAARWAPSIIFVGEVRDAETASEALRASINGRLVVCTTHADNVVMAVERLYSLANGTAGGSEDVANLLSNGLAGVVHQRLEGEPTRRPKVEFLWLRGEEAHGPRNIIRNRRFDQLTSEVNLQLNRMLMSARAAGAAA